MAGPPGSVKLSLNGKAIGDLLQQANDLIGKPAAERIADAANAESKFGRYQPWLGDYVSRVYGLGAPKDSDRGRRLMRLLGQEAGRG